MNGFPVCCFILAHETEGKAEAGVSPSNQMGMRYMLPALPSLKGLHPNAAKEIGIFPLSN